MRISSWHAGRPAGCLMAMLRTRTGMRSWKSSLSLKLSCSMPSSSRIQHSSHLHYCYPCEPSQFLYVPITGTNINDCEPEFPCTALSRILYWHDANVSALRFHAQHALHTHAAAML